jgi:hypothetical protein
MKNRFIRLSYDTFQALVAKKCQYCPLRDGCPDTQKTPLFDIQNIRKRRRIIKEEEEEIKSYYARP